MLKNFWNEAAIEAAFGRLHHWIDYSLETE